MSTPSTNRPDRFRWFEVMPALEPTLLPASTWNKLFSGERDQIAAAVDEANAAGRGNQIVSLLLATRRKGARRTRLVLGPLALRTPYTERERRSALLGIGLLWGALGRELGHALDPKSSHADRIHAHQALIRRRDPRAAGPLLDAMLDGHALEESQCIVTLGSLGDQRVAEGLLRYVGLAADVERPYSVAHEFGVEVGQALTILKAQRALQNVRELLHALLPRQRAAAALVLAGWGDPSLAADLVPLVEDESPDVRIAAINGIAELNAAATLIPVQTVINDPDPRVREAAEHVLQEVSLTTQRITLARKPDSKKNGKPSS